MPRFLTIDGIDQATRVFEDSCGDELREFHDPFRTNTEFLKAQD